MLKQILNAYQSSFTGLSKETWLLSVVMLVNRCGYMAVPFMGLYVTQFLHRSEADAGIIISLFGAGSILGATAGGKLTDVFGFHPVQIVSSLLGGIFFLFFAQLTHFPSLCIMAFVISFFSEAFRPANYAAIAAYAKKGAETRSYSLNRLAINIGWAMGVSIGGIIASYNYKLLFLVDGLVAILVATAIFFILPAVKLQKSVAATLIEDVKIESPWQDWLFLKFTLLTAIFATCFFLMFRVVPVFYKEQWHLDESLIGIILGINGVIIALFEMVMISKIENKKSARFYIVTGVLIVSLSFAVFLIPKSFPLILALSSIVFFTFGEMLALPFINIFVMNRSNAHNRGQYAGVYTLSWSVAQVVGPAGGFALAKTFGYGTLWVAILILLLTCAYGFKSLAYNAK